MNLDPNHTPYANINSKCIMDLNVKLKTMYSSLPWIRQKIFSYDTNNTIHNRKIAQIRLHPN